MLKNAGFIVFLTMVFVIFSPYKTLAQSFPANSNSNEDIEPIIVKTDLITFNVSVTDINGIAVSGLTKDSFKIFDDKTPQEIHFFSDEEVPVSISVVFDTSGSMSGEKINHGKKLLANFIETSKYQDEFFLIDAGSKAKILLNGTRNADAVLEKFTYVEPNGKTALYDAVSLGIEQVKCGSHTKKIVLVISDGKDNNSRLTLRVIKNQLKETDVIIYTIGVGDYYSIVSKGITGRDVLKVLAETSGGKSFFPNNSVEMNETFEKIALEIRHLYSIGFYPSDLPFDGKSRRIRVKVSPIDHSKRLFVRNRKEYITEIKR